MEVSQARDNFYNDEADSFTTSNGEELDTQEVLEKWDNIDFKVSDKTLAVWAEFKAALNKFFVSQGLSDSLIDQLFDEGEAVRLCYYTLNGGGIGIWDGSWDGFFDKEKLKLVRSSLCACKYVKEAYYRIYTVFVDDIYTSIENYFS